MAILPLGYSTGSYNWLRRRHFNLAKPWFLLRRGGDKARHRYTCLMERYTERLEKCERSYILLVSSLPAAFLPHFPFLYGGGGWGVGATGKAL